MLDENKIRKIEKAGNFIKEHSCEIILIKALALGVFAYVIQTKNKDKQILELNKLLESERGYNLAIREMN